MDIYQLDTVIETHRKEGMISMNVSLFDLIGVSPNSHFCGQQIK